MALHVLDKAESRASSRFAGGLPVAVLFAAALVGIFFALRRTPSSDQAWGSDVTLARLSTFRPAPELHFRDVAGRRLTLMDFRGKVVLLNIWATWCLPCRREMPTLDRLQQVLGGAHFQVVALSIDTGGALAIERYFESLGMHDLGVYVDSTMTAASALDITGTPTTFLIDASGREIGRHEGPAKWDSPGNEQFLRSFIAASTRGAGRPGS